MDFRAGNLASIDPVLQVQVRIWFNAGSGAETRDTSSQIEPWKSETGLLLELEYSSDSLTCQVHGLGIIHVIMHADQTGHDGVPREVEYLRTRRNRRGDRVSNSSDSALTND